tara:strand:+ start:138 stop:821 length:684 start_codon:yes stop_codon:yes gene_type:complete
MSKNILLAAFLLLFSFASAKEVKISVMPEDTKIYVDGVYVGDGYTTVNVRRRESFIVLKFEKDGYVTMNTKIFYKDKRKAVSYQLRKDDFYFESTPVGNANKFFTQEIDVDYFKDAKDTKDANLLVWKMMHQVLLNYFDEIESSDMLSGFIQTPWKVKPFPNSGIQVRTRVTVKQSNIGNNLTYKIKISSETASIGTNREESFQETMRILKKYESLISEFQSRLGKI